MQPEDSIAKEMQVPDQIKLIEAQASAKEVASKFIGKYGILMIVFLVCVGVFAATILPAEALTPVVGLVSTAAMALIGILTGITGTAPKQEKPEFQVIQNLIDRLDQQEPMRVDVADGRVTVTKGSDTIALDKPNQKE
jgi:hypothetical protein